MTFRRSLAFEMASFLAWNTVSARPAVLGVVVEAERVYLNTIAVTAGATVCDGDSFSTAPGGMLLLRGDAFMLELGDKSVVTVRTKTNSSQGTEAELSQGTVDFKTELSSALEIVALEAHVRPAGEAPTIGQVSVVGPKELVVRARRGPLQFLHREETETIAEGESYRVILDPSGDDANKNRAVKAAKVRKTFLLVAVTGALAGAATDAAIHDNHGHKKMESPDRP